MFCKKAQPIREHRARANILFISITTFCLKFLNRKHSQTRIKLGKSPVLVDRSMQDPEPEVAGNETEQGAATNPVEDKAFDDLTDLKNEDFIFVY